MLYSIIRSITMTPKFWHLNLSQRKGEAWHRGSVWASDRSAPGLNLDSPQNICHTLKRAILGTKEVLKSGRHQKNYPSNIVLFKSAG